jgi:exo-beta-1,3-glucanase (GH17 family)
MKRTTRLRDAVVALLILLAAAPMPARIAAGQVPPFIGYLEGAAPAMVAFNPAGYDPYQSQAFDDARLGADLAALRPAFDGLILYAYQSSLTPRIVAQAAAQGYRAVLLAIWDPLSEAEVSGVAELLQRYREVLALAVCIGNEGINDNRYRIEDLIAARARLAAGAVPVTTSEPAGDYGWRPLRDFGDFLAPNIHPAIDREGLDAEQAVAWVRARAEAIALLARKLVLVKETGVPHAGAAGFTLEGQRSFWAEWLAHGRLAKVGEPSTIVSYAAAFEAFDAPWKAVRLGSPIEGSWGLMSAERVPHPAFLAWAAARAPIR